MLDFVLFYFLFMKRCVELFYSLTPLTGLVKREYHGWLQIQSKTAIFFYILFQAQTLEPETLELTNITSILSWNHIPTRALLGQALKNHFDSFHSRNCCIVVVLNFVNKNLDTNNRLKFRFHKPNIFYKLKREE